MKRLYALVLALTLLLAFTPLTGCSQEEAGETVRIYNWGDYIAPGVIELFEEETGIEVVYDTFETNEDMYLKLKNSSGYTYDVVIPSDYMISKMLREDMLAEIDFNNVPNAAGIDERFKNLDYDPTGAYSVPYMWGTVCIAYDPEQVTEEVNSWDILWDEDYSRRIFMIDSERDSIGVALLSLGYSLRLLFYKAVIWSCDIGIIREQDDTLAYAIPDTGTNVWYDAAVILKDAENKANAEAFLNFLCRPDVAQMNADYMGSASPVSEALANQDESIRNDPIVNPPAEELAKYEVFQMVEGAASLYEEIWSYVLAS